jgi:hypothetical protein
VALPHPHGGQWGGMCLQAGGRVEGPALGVGPVSAARKGECTARKRLLERMVRWVPVRFDHVVVDSHYSGTPFLEPPGRSGLAVLVRLTDKLAELVEATQAGVRGTSASAIYRFDGGVVEVWDPSIFEQCWWTPRSPAWPWGWSGSTACITSTGPAAQTPATPPPRSPHSLDRPPEDVPHSGFDPQIWNPVTRSLPRTSSIVRQGQVPRLPHLRQDPCDAPLHTLVCTSLCRRVCIHWEIPTRRQSCAPDVSAAGLNELPPQPPLRRAAPRWRRPDAQAQHSTHGGTL